MAAPGGVERGCAAAPRQPALVKPSRRALYTAHCPAHPSQPNWLACIGTLECENWKSPIAARSHRAFHKAVE